MGRKIEFYRKIGEKVVYRAESLSRITNQNLKAFIRAMSTRGCKILFEEKIENEYEILAGIDHKKYNVALCYSVNTGRLVGKTLLPAGIRPFRFRTARGCRYDLGKKVGEFFSDWKSYLGPRYLEGARIGTRMLKDPSRYLCLKKNRKTVALVYMMDWVDWRGRPVDWVGHIWIDPELSADDRSLVHGYVSSWWKKTSRTGRVQGVVNSFNVRSQKFFRKMGFEPECMHILKTK